jgi:hypothetical protein
MSSFFDVRVPRADNVEQSDWEGLWERVVELVMWKNVGRSAFWFGSRSVIYSLLPSQEISNSCK